MRPNARESINDELATIRSAEIETAKDVGRTAYQKDRQRALDYYLGNMPDTPPAKGRSAAMSRDVPDVVHWMLPGLMRAFFSGDKIVDFLPAVPSDRQFAAQATEYINFIFRERCDGYGVMWDAIWNSLVMRVGPIKFWWDDTPEHKIESYSGLDDDGLAAVLQDDHDFEVLELEEDFDRETGQIRTHSLKINRVMRNGRINIDSLPLDLMIAR